MNAVDLSIYAACKDRENAENDYVKELENYTNAIEEEYNTLYRKMKKVKKKNKALRENIEDALVYIKTSDTIIDSDKEKLSLILSR